MNEIHFNFQMMISPTAQKEINLSISQHTYIGLKFMNQIFLYTTFWEARCCDKKMSKEAENAIA